MVLCKISQDFAVNSYIGLLEKINESGVGETKFADGGVDLQVPEVPEGALLSSAVAEGVGTSFQHGWPCKTDLALSAPFVAFYALQEILAALNMLCTSFDSWHRLKTVRERSLDDSS